jgi:hypothetical protein
MTFSWPASDAALLAWSQLLLTWVVAMYYAGRTESVWGRTQLAAGRRWYTALPRFALLVVVPITLTGRRVAATTLLVLVGCALAALLMWARERANDRWRSRGAELEIGITGAYVALSAMLVGSVATRPLISLLRLPMSERRIAALCFSAAILGFFVRGGTQIVRAILNKAGSLPKKEAQVDEAEYNRGRLVGSIERLLLAGMVAAGSYAALAFTIAAKGLVRSKEFENRDFAEYFLIGTLASTALAMVAGGLLRLIFTALW